MSRTWRVDRLGHPAVPLLLAVDDDDGALVYVGLGAQAGKLHRFARRHGAHLVVERGGPSPARRQISEYLAGRRRKFKLELRPLGSEFSRAAWEALTQIPFGQTITYGEQANWIDQPKASRAVGRANGANPLPIVVPCHRVVGSAGDLTGFGGGVELKRWLLQLERRRRVPDWTPHPRPATAQLGLFG